MRIIRKIIIFAFIISLGLGLWYYFKNKYSKEAIKLEILGEREVSLLKETTFIVNYKNQGEFAIENAKLVFECPEGSLYCKIENRIETPQQEKKLRKEIFLGTIYPKEEGSFQIKARLLGKEGEGKIARATLYYKLKNLKANYENSTTFITQIKKVPLAFNLDVPSSVESGRDFDFSLNFFSNLEYPLFDIGIKFQYPKDFKVLETEPKSLEENYFEISTLNPGQGGRIKIKGILNGNVGEKQIFHAIFGVWREGKYIPLKKASAAIEIAKSSLYISQLINKNPEYIANLGEILHYEIYFRNVGEKPFENLTLVCKLKGEIFDLDTITVERGFHSPGSEIILWDWKKNSQLKFLPPGEEGKVEFWVKLKDKAPLEKENLKVSNEVIFSEQTRKEFWTKVNTKLSFSQEGKINDEIFNSLGPLPPLPGKESQFTIFWEIENFYNEISNLKIKAVLSPYAKLTGKIYPEDSVFSFDSETRELIWQIDNLKPKEKTQFVFQVSLLLPENLSENEKEPKKYPILISSVVVTGKDEWTGQSISFSFPPISTNLTTLPPEEIMVE